MPVGRFRDVSRNRKLMHREKWHSHLQYFWTDAGDLDQIVDGLEIAVTLAVLDDVLGSLDTNHRRTLQHFTNLVAELMLIRR